MKAGKFIEKYLSQCEDTIVCLHAPDNFSSSMFSIDEWHHEIIDRPNLVYDLIYEVSQITAKVENFDKSLNVVIHIYTEYSYEKVK